MAALLAFGAFKLTLKEGAYVSVKINGAETARYALSEDREQVITTGQAQDQTNVLVIQGGVAEIRSANCPDQICAHHRPISQTGETIVCLPHKVVVAVESAD